MNFSPPPRVTAEPPVAEALAKRQSGVLLHISSLPDASLNHHAYRFVDFLADAGFSVWQILPLCPTHTDGSPYNGTSAFAGNPDFIDLSFLQEPPFSASKKTLINEQSGNTSVAWSEAYACYIQHLTDQADNDLQTFINYNQSWLEDYATFAVLKKSHPQGWVDWPELFRHPDAKVITDFKKQHIKEIQGIYFQQYQFFKQWLALKTYANERGVKLFGDVPIFVAHDSADCWANQGQFLLEANGQPTIVTGVPPDYFSETGQRWGNPHYNWHAMQGDDFKWWSARFQHNFQLFDLVRIDHFRGFESSWAIPANEEFAINGYWQQTPGEALFATMQHTLAELAIVAEDLGIITPEVESLRDQFGFPGMKILQFAFDGNTNNPYLPHKHIPNCVVYTGTHDNDTSVGWYSSLPADTKSRVDDYLSSSEPMPWAIIRSALASVANTAIFPMQDLLELGGECRMNTPGTTENNWQWHCDFSAISRELTEKLKHLNLLYQRI